MANREVGFIVTDEYVEWIENVKTRIMHSQIKAAIRVNDTMLDLYWNLGKDIVEKQKASNWGDGFLQAMSRDLKKAFPNVSGFSAQNLKSIRY